jgi:DnaJ-class molecular chaperone
MSYIQTTNKTCRTCGGAGFIFRGQTMRHEIQRTQNGITKREIYTSRVRDLCPECLGSGVHFPREVQRTPWELAFQIVNLK